MLEFLKPSGINSVNISDIKNLKPFSSKTEQFVAARNTAFRESLAGAATMGAAIANLEAEVIDQDPALDALRMRNFARGFDWQYQFGGPQSSGDILPKKTPKELKEMGIAEQIIKENPDGLTEQAAAVMQEAYEQQQRDKEILENAKQGIITTTVQLGGGLVGSAADPINLIPLGRGINRAKMLTQGTKVLSLEGTKVIARSAAIGGVEGFVGAGLSDIIAFPLANEWGADLGWEEAAADMALSGLLGSLLSGLGTTIGTRAAAETHQNALTKAISDLEDGKSVDVGEITGKQLAYAKSLVEIRKKARVLVDEGYIEPDIISKEFSYEVAKPDTTIDDSIRSLDAEREIYTKTSDGTVGEDFADLENRIADLEAKHGETLPMEQRDEIMSSSAEIQAINQRQIGMQEAIDCIVGGIR